MTSYSRVRGFLVMGSLFLWLGIQAYGQGTQSTVLGSVTDSSGGAVPGATVTVKNQGTSIERSLTTNESGDYRITGLEAGVYQVSITAQGFKSYVRTDIDLNASQIKRVDAALEVGAVTSAITVRGGPGQVETETATLSNVKPARDFIELPLSVFGRGDTNILVVAAGYNSVGCCDVVINGSRGGAFNLTADGAAVNNQAYSGRSANGVSASVEAFKEAKVITANAPAEYGQVSQIEVVTKSGENILHGSLFWGNFDTVTATRSFFDTSKPSFLSNNTFDITSGGPVYVPHLYDGRNKTFYFFSYSGLRFRSGNRIYTSVPTDAFRRGDFSAICSTYDASGRCTDSAGIQLVDPTTGQPFGQDMSH